MKLKFNTLNLARGALVVAAVLSPHAASAVTATTTYTTGDLLLGFRLEGNPNTLVVNLGSAANYIPLTLNLGGNTPGNYNGSLKQIQFGVVPGGSTAVFSLATDLAATFGPTWATNNTTNGTADLSWAVAGATSAASTTFSGVFTKSYFLTLAETTPGVQTATPADTNSSQDGVVRANVDSVGTTFRNKSSTDNSSVVRLTANTENWTQTQVSAQGANNFGGTWVAEQAFGSNTNAGPTNSILDLYLNQGATGANASNPNYYLGSFGLTSTGQLYYGSSAAVAQQIGLAVPEPGSMALLGLGVAALGFVRRRKPALLETRNMASAS